MDWTEIEEVAEKLEEAYPEEKIYSLRFTVLRGMVLKLEGFAGDPSRSNERVLEAIQAAWVELRNDNS